MPKTVSLTSRVSGYLPILLVVTAVLCLMHSPVANAKPKMNTATSKETEKPFTSFIEKRHTISEQAGNYNIRVNYPSFGAVLVDNDIAIWVQQRISFFEEGLRDIPFSNPEFFTLNIDYTVTQTSLRCISIVFTIQTKTGSPTLEEGLLTLNYQAQEGRRLKLQDIFANTNGLLDFFSLYSRRVLTFRDWLAPDATFIYQGTTPQAVNFMFYTITPLGLDLYFPPNQVASAFEGSIKVSIPLAELAPFQPNTSLWGHGQISQ